MPEGGESTLGANGVLTLCHLVGAGILSLALDRFLTDAGVCSTGPAGGQD